MLNQLFNGIFSTSSTAVGIADFLLCMAVSLIIGLFLAFIYMYRNSYTQSFAVTLAILPAAVCMVIMMVNGNLGAGVAVAGAFGLVRFRSAQGSAREIIAIFLAMATGLATGMGYLGYACLFAIVIGLIWLVYVRLGFGRPKSAPLTRTLHVTIPENLDYTDVFDDLMDAYTSEHELLEVKTSNMGSLFKLTWNLTLKDASKEKDFVDDLRCRNGNLEISISKQENVSNNEL